MDVLEVAVVQDRLSGMDCAQVWRLEVEASCDSTNTELLARASRSDIDRLALCCERQTGGRGRLGRAWLAAQGTSLTFSAGARFARPIHELSALSLAVGVACAEALETGGHALQLKWPNDLLLHGAKFGGILIERAKSAAPGTSVVVGVGLNVFAAPQLDQPTACLADAGLAVPRNELLARLLHGLHRCFALYEAEGFAAFKASWTARHAHQNRGVRLSGPDGETINGVARDIDHDGSLILDTEMGRRSIQTGDVSLREAA